jgi:GNAT superfamily N-acetyltransferase
MSTERLTVTVRPAQESDTADVLELTKTIWDGDDYVPHVWADWLADTQGRLLVAEHDGRILGLGKLSRLSSEDWWLEGMRVHPEYQGHGIASQIHEALVYTWQEMGSGTLRLGTASNRYPIHHLCARMGFEKVNEITFYTAQSLEEEAGMFEAVEADAAAEALDFALHSQLFELSNGLMDLGWRSAPPRLEYIQQAVGEGRAFWWRSRDGLLLFFEDEEGWDEGALRNSVAQLLACSLEDLPALLSDYRRLAAKLGFAKANWMAPLRQQVQEALEAAGFTRDWDASMWVFAKKLAQD